jgi:hypothetical protein
MEKFPYGDVLLNVTFNRKSLMQYSFLEKKNRFLFFQFDLKKSKLTFTSWSYTMC